MTYQQAIDFLLSQLPMYSRMGAAAYKADLTNITQLCAYLDHPEKKFKAIHIAGTNGKGSVSHMLAAILQIAGFKTGLHTSPHLKDYRERILLNGKMIPEDFVVAFTQKIKPVIEQIEPSFFEMSVAMAFDFFAQQKVDIAIIETGLGGRLDSTNILSPILSIITNISKDHSNLLGNTLEEIAVEKAGIIKRNTPVVIGEKLPITKEVFIQKAEQLNSPISFASDNYLIADWRQQKNKLFVDIATTHDIDHHHYELDLAGIYQSKNLVTVLEACRQLELLNRPLTRSMITEGLRQVKKLTGLHGRWELINTHPDTYIDVAHNEAGIEQLLKQIELIPHHQLHIVLGMVNDKDISRVLDLMPVQAAYYFTQAHIPRALSALDLKEKAAARNLKGETYENVATAITTARAHAKKDDLVVICGSIFLIAEVNF